MLRVLSSFSYHFYRLDLGTSHVSTESCDDVRELMQYLKPDVLFVELCPQRIPILMPSDNEEEKTGGDSSNDDIGFFESMKNLQENGMSRVGALSTILLTKVQGDYASTLGVNVGQEFKEAYECALSLNSESFSSNVGDSLSRARCRVVLGDRPVRLTLVRAWESLSIFGKIKLVIYLLWSSIKQPSAEELKKWMDEIMRNGDLLTASIKELSKAFPSIGRVIIDERDAYMYNKLCQTANLGSRRIVAVVGAGHCNGICSLARNLNQENTEDALRKLVETKQWKVDEDQEIKSLTRDVIELQVT